MSNYSKMNSLEVEIVQKRQSRANEFFVAELVRPYLSNMASLTPGTILKPEEISENNELLEHVESLIICDTGDAEEDSKSHVGPFDFVFHIHKLEPPGADRDSMCDGDSGEMLAACEVWNLPNAEFHGIWESLIYDSNLKLELIRFISTAFEFEERGVDPRHVAWNRAVLLHGPPGSGKTSLCRAIAHKLAVRLNCFHRARLLEINAHGLFSKWFSESGKLVARLFERIQEIADDDKSLTCVLIDEVESLAHARRAALAGLEPSDSIRAVNAVLTALDRLKRQPNVLVFTTSNETGAVDIAFLDRIDLKRCVGPPSAWAAYSMLKGSCEELMDKGIVFPREILFCSNTLKNVPSPGRQREDGWNTSVLLQRVAQHAAKAQVSARALRRLPFIARALHVTVSPPTLNKFVVALRDALFEYINQESKLQEHPRHQRRESDVNGHKVEINNGKNE